MAAADTTATLSCPVRGDDTGDYDVLVQWAITAPTLYTNPILIASGNNAISPGINGITFQLLVIIPPAAALTDTWSLRGVNGDTGLNIAVPGVQILSGINLTPGLVLNAAGGGYTITTRWLR
jgi:hypothetical protein